MDKKDEGQKDKGQERYSTRSTVKSDKDGY